MQASKNERLSYPFVMAPSDVRKLLKAFEQFTDDVVFEIECQDGLARSFDDIESLLEFENPASKEIQSLQILGRSSESPYLRASIRFSNDTYSTITIWLEGPEDAVIKLNDAIEHRLQGMKPWYAHFTRLNFIYLSLAAILGMWVILLGIVALSRVERNSVSNSDPAASALATTVLLVYGIIVGFIAIGWVFNKFRKKVFPIGAFTIGQGKTRHEHREMIGKTVVLGFFVSLAAGIIATLLVLAAT